MAEHGIVLLTDRRDRSRALAETVRTLAACRVVGVDEPLLLFEPVIGVIADLALDRPWPRRTLATLVGHRGEPRIPVIVLTRVRGDAAIQEANRLGATACFPDLTDDRTVVTALFRQLHPHKTLTDLLVERSAARTALLLGEMFEAAGSGRIDPRALDPGVDLVVDALRDGGLRRWLDVVRAHDDITLRHCLLVAGLAAHFALHLRLSGKDREALVRAGLVHDVGKAMIPLAILNKAGPLDPEETRTMRTHAAIGHAILVASGVDDPVTLAAARHHHEMLDGSGYPDGLRGEAICDAVRLLTICDVYAALADHRPYRPAMTQDDALAILGRMAAYGLETALVDAFAAALRDEPGSTVPSGPSS